MLQLFDSVTARAEQCQDAVRPAHVSRAGDHKIDVTTVQVALDFRDPIAIARNERLSGQPR